MNQNNNLSVLPWYKSLDEQNHRKSYAYGKVYPLITENKTILPFQILRSKRTEGIETVTLVRLQDGTRIDITTNMIDTGLMIKTDLEYYDIIIYPSIISMTFDAPDGQYYLCMTDTVEVWYSEVFTLVDTVEGYIKLEWYNRENLEFDQGVIVYQNPRFVNKLYLCTELGKPEYVFEEEGETRDGYFFPTKQISEKKYKCTILAPEYLCDVMRLIRMSDYVRLTDQYGIVYNCDTFLMTPEWQAQGDLASVQIEFETNTVVKNNAKGYSTGDFNEDFNEDYSTDYI